MTFTEFTDALGHLSRDDMSRIAASLVSDTAGDEVDAWRATMAIDRALRHTHRTRLAACAAWDAAQAVQRAARSQGMTLPDQQVTHVARAAAEVARGMIAGDAVVPEVSRLLQHWFPLFANV